MSLASPHRLMPDWGDDSPERLENDYLVILEWLNDAHCTLDPTWRFIEVSPRATEFLGFPEEALLGRVLWDIFPAALGTLFEQKSRAAMQSRKPTRLEDYSLNHLGLSTHVLFYPDPRGLSIYYRDMTDRKRTHQVEQLADQLRALASELTRVEHRERRRLGLVLHDHVQQLLVAAKMQVEAIGRGVIPGSIKSAVERTSSILRDAIAASRTLAVELSPPVLHQSGLAAGLAWLAEHFEEKHGFQVHFQDESHGEPATEEAALLLFESTRELLFNCVKHAGVNEGYVTLKRIEPGRLGLTVEDRGRGFEPAAPAKTPNRLSLGLFSIQQRLAYCGGRMEIESAPGAGVRVTLLGPSQSISQPTSEAKSA